MRKLLADLRNVRVCKREDSAGCEREIIKRKGEHKMEELKINGQYEKEDGKRIMRLINEIKVRGMRLAKVVDENDMPIIANIIAMRLLQYAAEKQIERVAPPAGSVD